jgi:hypothetical protein
MHAGTSCVAKVERALELGCSDRPQALFLHGVALSVPQIARFDQALASLRECQRLHPQHEHVAEELQEVRRAQVSQNG